MRVQQGSLHENSLAKILKGIHPNADILTHKKGIQSPLEGGFQETDFYAGYGF